MKITWGLHKVLYKILTTDDNFSNLFFNPDLSEKVLIEVLSDRDSFGNITEPFNVNILTAEECETYLQEVYDYFTDFFFRRNKRAQETQKRMEKLQMADQTSSN